MQTAHKYRSSVSYWLFVPLILLIVVSLVGVISAGQVVAIVIMVAVTLGILLPMLLNTNYTIAGDTLTVRSGFLFRAEIPVSSIRSISKTSTVLSSPALSIKDRIEITYNRFDSVIISPAERAAFVAELVALNPDIEVKEGV